MKKPACYEQIYSAPDNRYANLGIRIRVRKAINQPLIHDRSGRVLVVAVKDGHQFFAFKHELQECK